MKRLYPICAVLMSAGVCFAQAPGWVVLPINEYAALHGKAYPTEHEAEAPSLEATLTRIDYDLRLNDGLATGRASLTVDVLKDGWVRVPIPSGLFVREARIGNKLVSLAPVPGRSGEMSAVLYGKGRSVLLLDVGFGLDWSGSAERLTLPAGGSGVTHAVVAGTPQDVEVSVTGGFVADKSAGRWVAYARGNEPLVFSWRKKIEERPVELPLRMRGSLVQLFGLGEDSTALSAEVEIEVVQGSARQVKMAVPQGVDINQVRGAAVGDWDVEGGTLAVTFLEPVDRAARFTIGGETHLARDGAIDVPLLRLLEVEREAGGAAIEVLGAGEIKETKAEGLDAAEASELGQMVAARQSPSLSAFRLLPGAQSGKARSLHVQLARYAQQAVLTANVEEARYRALMSMEGKTLVQARYAVRNNQRSFVRITLPAGAAVWSAALAGRPVRPGTAPDGSLVFPLAKAGPRGGGEDAPLFAIEILYLARAEEWSGKGHAKLALPALDLPVSRTGLVLYYPPLFHVTAAAGAFRTEAYEKAESVVLGGGEEPLPDGRGSVTELPSSTQALVNRYRAKTDARKTAAALLIHVSFPAVGPSLYLVSELTGEGKAPSVELDYQKEKKGGVR